MNQQDRRWTQKEGGKTHYVKQILVENVNSKAFESWDSPRSKKLQQKPLEVPSSLGNDLESICSWLYSLSLHTWSQINQGH
jgi:hypothetical protein